MFSDENIIRIAVLAAALAVLLGIVSRNAEADELTLDYIQYSRTANEDMVTVGPYRSAKLTYTFDNGMYLFASNDTAKVTYLIDGFTYKFIGLGAGLSETKGNWTWFGDVGYYLTSNSWGNREFCDEDMKGTSGAGPGTGCNEGLYYYMKRRFQGGSRFLPIGHIVETDPTWGFSVGVRYQRQLSKNWSVGVVGVYRNLVFDERIKSRLPEGTGDKENPYWYKEGAADYSGFGVGVNVSRKLPL